MKKRNFRYLLGFIVVCVCFGLNAAHALSEYGLTTCPLSIFVLAQSSSSGSGSSSSGSGSSSSGSGTSSGGNSSTNLGSGTCFTASSSSRVDFVCAENRVAHDAIITFECVGDGDNVCRKGTIVTYYNCYGESIGYDDNALFTSCR